MVDSHCHIADDVFSSDLEEVIARARAAGLERVMAILEAGNAQEAAQAERAQQMWPELRASVGVHPHGAHAFSGDPARAGALVRDQIGATPFARAVGEIGLDYHYDFSPPDVQQAVFRHQLRVARELDVPVIIHTREAEEDTVAILHDEGGPALRGVLHCFTGTAALADAGLELGFYISVAGIVTFPKAQELRDTLAGVPLERLLIETDSPFLAPVPHRGTRNEPSRVVHVAERLAAERGVPLAEVGAATTRNFHTLFRP